LSAIVSPAAGRLVSLDAFRGATIAAMILVNNPGDHATTFPPLLHAKWNGWTFTDLVFPFFLWIVGAAMTFSFARRRETGAGRGQLIVHTVRRAAIIFGVGLFLNAFPDFDFAHLRIPGVLQRIAICYLVGALVVLYTGWKGQAWAITGFCGLYWVLMMAVPVPGYGAGVLEPVGNFGQWIDNMLLPGHLYANTKVWDPEGLVTTLPAIATLLFGVLTGHMLRMVRPQFEKAAWILVWGVLLTALGSVLELAMPINKQLWTVSYAVFVSGLAALGFGCFYWFIDVQGYKKPVQPFVIYGMNAITAYTLSSILADVLSVTGVRRPLYEKVFLGPICACISSLLFALSMVAVCYAAVWAMHRRGWYVRI
jgi:predicted acyltransferase